MSLRAWRELPRPETIRRVFWDGYWRQSEVPLSEVYAHLDLPREPRPYVLLNMIMTQNGEATIAGSAMPIGTSVDWALFSQLRSLADVTLNGGGTLVKDDVAVVLPARLAEARTSRGHPAMPTAAIVSSALDFPEATYRKRYFTDRRFAKLLVTTGRASTEARRRAEDAGAEVVVVEAGLDGRPDMEAVLREFGRRGLAVVLAEGGPTLNRTLFARRLVHEYFLTISPRITGEPGVERPVAGEVGDVHLELLALHAFQFTDPLSEARPVEWYARYRPRWAPGA